MAQADSENWNAPDQFAHLRGLVLQGLRIARAIR